MLLLNAKGISHRLSSTQSDKADKALDKMDKLIDVQRWKTGLNTPTNGGLSPKLRSVKRSLAVSPSTPVGLARKVLFRGYNNGFPQITSSEDVVEMIYLESDVSDSKISNRSDASITTTNSPRKALRGGRRGYTFDIRRSISKAPMGKVDNCSFWDIDEQISKLTISSSEAQGSLMDRLETQGSTSNSIKSRGKQVSNVKTLKIAHKKTKHSRKSLKTKKNMMGQNKPTGQRLIDEYLLPTPINNTIITGEATGSSLSGANC